MTIYSFTVEQKISVGFPYYHYEKYKRRKLINKFILFLTIFSGRNVSVVNY